MKCSEFARHCFTSLCAFYMHDFVFVIHACVCVDLIVTLYTDIYKRQNQTLLLLNNFLWISMLVNGAVLTMATDWLVAVTSMGLLPDTYTCGLCMRRECRERFSRHRFHREPLVSDPGMHHGTCVTHGMANPRWCGKRSRRMRNLPFYVSGKRFMFNVCCSLKAISKEKHINNAGHTNTYPS